MSQSVYDEFSCYRCSDTGFIDVVEGDSTTPGLSTITGYTKCPYCSVEQKTEQYFHDTTNRLAALQKLQHDIDMQILRANARKAIVQEEYNNISYKNGLMRHFWMMFQIKQFQNDKFNGFHRVKAEALAIRLIRFIRFPFYTPQSAWALDLTGLVLNRRMPKEAREALELLNIAIVIGREEYKPATDKYQYTIKICKKRLDRISTLGSFPKKELDWVVHSVVLSERLEEISRLEHWTLHTFVKHATRLWVKNAQRVVDSFHPDILKAML